MAPSFVGICGSVAGGYFAFPPTPVTCDAAVSMGNLVLVVCSTYSNVPPQPYGSVTDNLGNSYTKLAGAGADVPEFMGSQMIWATTVTNPGHLTSISIDQRSGLSASESVLVAQFSGISVDTFNTYTYGTDSAPGTAGSVTIDPAIGVFIHVTCMGIDDVGTMSDYVPPTGFTNTATFGGTATPPTSFFSEFGALNYKIGTAYGAITDSWTGSLDWTSGVLYFLPEPSKCLTHYSMYVPAVAPFAGTIEIDYDYRPAVVMAYGNSASIYGTSFFNWPYSAAGVGWDSPIETGLGTTVGSGDNFAFSFQQGGSNTMQGNFGVIHMDANIGRAMLTMDKATCHPNLAWFWDQSPVIGYESQILSGFAIGGVGLQFKEGSFNLTAAAGPTDTTIDVGFEPQVVMFLWSKVPFYDAHTLTYGPGPGFGFGAASSASAANQYSHYTECGYIVNYSNAYAIHRTGACITTGASMNVALTAINPTGFTLRQTGGDGNARIVGYLAMRYDDGGEFYVGTDGVQGTSFDTYTIGFEPEAMLLSHGNCDTANTVYTASGMWGFGGFDIDSQDSINQGYTFGARNNNTAICFSKKDVDGIHPLVAGEATGAITANGFGLLWTTSDGVSRPFGYVAMKSGDGTCSNPRCPQVTGIYRRVMG